MYSDLLYLAVPLPEDIQRLKDYGDFERLSRVINMRLAKPLPKALQKRLEMEKIIAPLMASAYPYTQREAFAQFSAAIEGATEEELDRLRDEGAADWIYAMGETRYHSGFLSNLIQTRPDLLARAKDPTHALQQQKKTRLLDDVIARMREKGEARCEMRLLCSLRVKPEYERPGETLRAYLPIPVEYAQVEHFRLLRTSHAPKRVSAPDYPQRTVCFEEKLAPGTRFEAEYAFTAHAHYVSPDPDKASDAQPTFYTEQQPPHIQFTPYLRMLAREIVGREQNPVRKARLIYDFVTTCPTYSFVRPYLAITDLPGYMASGLKGDCGIFALLFIALCRIAGVPARWQSGMYVSPLSVGNHDWAQFYIAPYGWLYADCSFGNSAWRNGSKARHDFYFGNLDPYRMPAASEFQCEFDPPPKFLRYDPYDNQSGEAEYADAPLSHDQLETQLTVLEMKEV